MERRTTQARHGEVRRNCLLAAAQLFLDQGYGDSTLRQIAQKAGVNVSTMVRVMKSKENILRELTQYVLESQFDAAGRLVRGKTEDPILLYAAETVMQLHMAENSTAIRDLYAAAYSLPESSSLIMQNIAGKLRWIFGAHLPHLEPKDFYELEIASSGIIRSFMTVPCDLYFTMDRKVRRYLEATLRVYQVPEEKIEEAIAFVAQFDYPTIAREVVEGMLACLRQNDQSEKEEST